MMWHIEAASGQFGFGCVHNLSTITKDSQL